MQSKSNIFIKTDKNCSLQILVTLQIDSFKNRFLVGLPAFVFKTL